MKKTVFAWLLALVSLPLAAQDVAGRAVLVVGQAFATDSAGTQRILRRGDAVFSGETISTQRHSYVNVAYTDDGRTLIGPDSQLKIEDYSYSPPAGGPRNRGAAGVAQADSGRSVFALLKGGFRAVTGLIGKNRRENYAVRTAVATIGIRGTDAVYVDCSDGRCGDLGPGSSEDLSSVVIGVYEGGITATNLNNGQTLDIDPGQFVQTNGTSFYTLAGMPGVLVMMPMQDPQTCE